MIGALRQVLQGRIMTFVNQIAEIIHGVADEFYGVALAWLGSHLRDFLTTTSAAASLALTVAVTVAAAIAITLTSAIARPVVLYVAMH